MTTNLKDVPNELLEKIREQFEKNNQVRELRVRQQRLQREGKWMESLGVAKQIEALYDKVVCEYLQESERQVSTIDISDMDIPKSDKDALMQRFLVCFMCADMIETSIMDMDDILHRHDRDLHVETFDDMREVFALAKEKLKFLKENSGYMNDLFWADKCDDMYDMIMNKSASIIRKRTKDSSWGKNKAEKEKFI